MEEMMEKLNETQRGNQASEKCGAAGSNHGEGKKIHSEEEILAAHEVRLTAMRIYVYKAMETFQNTFCLSDLEEKLDTVDKSTIFRILKTFNEHHLLHEIEDGSGSKKYCLCHNTHACGIEELHCHFYCNECHKTYCLTDAHIPLVSIPEGFVPDTAEYIIKGLCPECSRKKKRRELTSL